jgi:uncharacterized protein (DUF924 family)
MLSQEVTNEILQFWFPNNYYNKFWFDKNSDFDITIKVKYIDLIILVFKKLKVMSTDVDFHLITSNELVAIIILLDQFSRNIERTTQFELKINTINVHDCTEAAEKISKFWISQKYYLNTPLNMTVFALMPLRHLNKIRDYNIIIEILEEIKDDSNKLYKNFKNQTIRRLKLLKD